MIRRGVSYEEVAQAAEELRSQSETPTIERIRHLLGGTGSNTTISKYLHEWRYSIGTHHPSSSDPVQIAVQRVWQQLRDETNDEINKIKEESNQLISQAQTSEKLALQKAEERQNQLTHLNDEFHVLQGNKEILVLDFKKLQQEHALLQERYKGLEERYADFQRISVKHQEDMSHAHKKELNHVMDKLQLQEEANQKLISELKTHNENQRQRFIVEIDSLKIQNHQLKLEIDVVNTKIKDKELESVKVKAELNAIVKECNQLNDQIIPQKDYLTFLEKNKEITNSILLEIKEIPKIDLTLSTISYFSEFNNSFHEFLRTSNETKSILNMFNEKIKNLNTDNE